MEPTWKETSNQKWSIYNLLVDLLDDHCPCRPRKRAVLVQISRWLVARIIFCSGVFAISLDSHQVRIFHMIWDNLTADQSERSLNSWHWFIIAFSAKRWSTEARKQGWMLIKNTNSMKLKKIQIIAIRWESTKKSIWTKKPKKSDQKNFIIGVDGIFMIGRDLRSRTGQTT